MIDMFRLKQNKTQNGFTLVEMLVATAVFAIVSVVMYQGYAQILKTTRILKVRTIASNVANEQIEIIRNLPYEDVGNVGGIPSGVVEPIQNVQREGNDFLVTTTIRNIDLEFDGTLGGVPDDLSPADNKLVEVEVSCALCQDYTNVIFNTNVAPESLESLSSNGALRINVFDANGADLALANVNIVNNSVSPAISINDVTGNNGILTIVDAPPSVESYEITVTKSGYSTDQTYTAGLDNPNPIKPHSTVSQGAITAVSFAIDQTSTINVESVTDTCVAVDSLDFDLASGTLIGTGPDILKYDQSHTTDGSGELTLSDIEWGTYTFSPTDIDYNVVGFDPINPFTILPGVNEDLKIILAPISEATLLISVTDQGTGIAITDATVNIQKTGLDMTQITGIGLREQTSWLGGSGQSDYIDVTRYASDDGNIAIGVTGNVQLASSLGVYTSTGELVSSTFDMGSTTTYGGLSWNEDVPSQTDVQFQIATSTSGTPTNFLGPDGTNLTFYTSTGTDVHSSHDNDRYFRYKIYLSTLDTIETPSVDGVVLNFIGDCITDGQTAFQGLSLDTYTVTVNAAGYQQFSQDIDLVSSWQEIAIDMNP